MVPAQTAVSVVFQHTATRRWLRPWGFKPKPLFRMFQHTATRRWLRLISVVSLRARKVSTHSHPKVAAVSLSRRSRTNRLFQHTATRRWLPQVGFLITKDFDVSTHSHPKVAAQDLCKTAEIYQVSTHSHPKVAA